MLHARPKAELGHIHRIFCATFSKHAKAIPLSASTSGVCAGHRTDHHRLSAREEVLKRYDLLHPIRTIYPVIPYNADRSEARIVEPTFNILHIANFEPRKNHGVALEAVAALPDELRRNTRLILVGKAAYRSHEQEFQQHLGRFDGHIQVEIHQGISEQEKERL